MRLLLDTHIAIWSVLDDPRLSVRALIADRANDLAVSAASLWEIAIKQVLARRGRADMPVSAAHTRSSFERAGFSILGVTADHAIAIETLPLLHGDPFDRFIIAQALAEPARLLTADRTVASYNDTIIAV